MGSPDRLTVLNQDRVTFCVDTNLLVEFRPLDALPWREVTPNATEIYIIIPSKVAEEMDRHKKKTGRLRRRGLEFAKLARNIEESTEHAAEIRSADPRITVAFGPIFRPADLDAQLYDLSDDDGRITAEVAKIMQANPETIFLADDSKPIRLAKQTGLLHRRPPESWRREEGPDERDTEIAELRRIVGTQPALVLGFPGAVDEKNRHVLDPPPPANCPSCIDALVRAALSVDRQASRDQLIDKYGISNDFFRLPHLDSRLTYQSLDEYEADYRAFAQQVQDWATELPGLLQTLGTIVPITIEVANEGDRAAEGVLVEAELHGPFRFVPQGMLDDFYEEILDPPAPPVPLTERIRVNLPEYDRRQGPRADLFHLQDEIDAGDAAGLLSWRCEELRHGDSHDLLVFVAPESPDARGALQVHATALEIPRPVKLTAPLLAVPAPAAAAFCSYLLRHSELLPQIYQRACVPALNAAKSSCPHGLPGE